jgi:hypothetical protein
MKAWIRIALPNGLGIVAGILNYSATTSKLVPLVCVGMSQPLKSGEMFQDTNLIPISIRGDVGQLREVVIPWDERAVLLGRNTPRDLAKGDVVLWRDATPQRREIVPGRDEVLIHVALNSITMVPDFIRVDQQVGFLLRPRDESSQPSNDGDTSTATRHKAELLGPFTVKAIGTRLEDSPSEKDAGGDPRVLTIPVKRLAESNQVEDKADRLEAALHNSGSEMVVGVVLFPDRQNGQ